MTKQQNSNPSNPNSSDVQSNTIPPTADQAWFESDILERFTRYVQVFTTSDHHSEACPSTPGQWDLAKILQQELIGLGLDDVELTEFCYVRATLKGNLGPDSPAPVIGFLAHMDTSPDCSGKGVKPIVHKKYAGGPIVLPSGERFDEKHCPGLLDHIGHDIITSDGTTLLGADDKAGVAEIMSAVRWLVEHPEFKHGDIEIIFTPDEEIGRGVDKIPRQKIKSTLAYTLDGDEEGSYNPQCFTAWTIDVSFKGRMIHPGDARGRMVNPVAMAGMFIANLPRNESPEATDGMYGYYCAQEVHGNMEEATFTLFIRDFSAAEIQRRLAYLEQLGKLVEAAYPGGSVALSPRKQYVNMYDIISQHPQIIGKLKDAIRATGMEPWEKNIRGGTDGARLTEQGLPTPNIFAGGMLFHSKFEWVPLQAMVRASRVVINLCGLWSQ